MQKQASSKPATKEAAEVAKVFAKLPEVSKARIMGYMECYLDMKRKATSQAS